MFDLDAQLEHLDRTHARIGRAHHELLRGIAELDRYDGWRDYGARDSAHLLAMRYGMSEWKARRWIAAAHALERLPAIAEALATGALGIDKVVELCRFATPETEAGLLRWAHRVSVGAIRHRGDRETRLEREQLLDVERSRSLTWWFFDDGRRFGLEAELPAADGAVVAHALERLARKVPPMPGEEDPVHADARRADALVAMCSSRADPAHRDRTSVVIHARLDPDGITDGEVEDGPPVHAATIERLLCNARIRALVEDDGGGVARLGPVRREPPDWMMRQVRYRDRECTFPGCGARRFTEAHHIVWWRSGGQTELANLALICSFHHRLVHEYGWSMHRARTGELSWMRPDGARYRAGPLPRDDPLAIAG